MTRLTPKQKREAAEEAKAKLAPFLTPGTTVYTVLSKVAASGMTRHIRVFIMRDGEPWDVSFLAARVLDYRIGDKTGGLVVGGCGMDMGFHVVNSLSYGMHGVTHPGPRCRACAKKEKAAAAAERPYQVWPCAERADHAKKITPERAARCWRPGYTLKHRWL